MELGPLLRAARIDSGLSLRHVAREVGISPSLLSQVETGKTHPSVATLFALAEYMDFSLDELVRSLSEERGRSSTSRTVRGDAGDPTG